MAIDGGDQQSHDVYPVVQVVNSEIRLVKISRDVTVEQLTGVTARQHLEKLKASRPQAFKASDARMRALGHREPGEVFVERTLRTTASKGTGAPGNSPYRLADTSESNSEGEIDFESWDGPGWTWQGNIYVSVYGYGDSVWSGEIDTDSTDYPWDWVDQTYASPDCSPHCGPDNQGRLSPPRPGEMTRGMVQLAKLSHGPIRSVNWDDWYNWSTCYRTGVLAGCGSAATGCWHAKGGWAPCWALWCVGAEIGSAIGCAL
jgi:hypothetical protein